MIAFLGMYDLPPLHAANDAFWAEIRRHLGTGPATLTRNAGPWDVWQSPELLLAQTCGYPYRARLHGTVQLVGTPDYGLPGCPPGHYNSVLIARRGRAVTPAELSGGTFAYNEPLSQSGWAGPVQHLNDQGVQFSTVIETGAHVASAHAVLAGKADLAGIDALTWALLREHDPDMAGLEVLQSTRPVPGLPYITGMSRDAADLFAAIALAIKTLAPTWREMLHLKGLVVLSAEDYLCVETPPGPVQR